MNTTPTDPEPLPQASALFRDLLAESEFSFKAEPYELEREIYKNRRAILEYLFAICRLEMLKASTLMNVAERALDTMGDSNGIEPPVNEPEPAEHEPYQLGTINGNRALIRMKARLFAEISEDAGILTNPFNLSVIGAVNPITRERIFLDWKPLPWPAPAKEA